MHSQAIILQEVFMQSIQAPHSVYGIIHYHIPHLLLVRLAMQKARVSHHSNLVLSCSPILSHESMSVTCCSMPERA